MTEQALWLDGNALAGLLQSCGEVHVIGEHRMYRGAGPVLRCPHCGDVALRVATLPDRYVLQLVGAWRLEIPRASN
jgi:hypothetical protein